MIQSGIAERLLNQRQQSHKTRSDEQRQLQFAAMVRRQNRLATPTWKKLALNAPKFVLPSPPMRKLARWT